MELGAGKLVKHSVVIVTEKRARSMALERIMEKAGFKVVSSASVYDALQIISQELPHLIITEATLADGDAAVIYDRLKKHEILNCIPIFVNILKKSKAELQLLENRDFAGVFAGNIEPQGLIKSVFSSLKEREFYSPYHIDVSKVEIDDSLRIAIANKLSGRAAGFLIAESDTQLDALAKFSCSPSQKEVEPAFLSQASNVIHKRSVYNLFPLHLITGEGRQWVEKLPDVYEKVPELQNQEQRVICVTENDSDFNGLSGLLTGHGITLIHVKQLADAFSLVQKKPSAISSVYIHDSKADTLAPEVVKTYTGLSRESLPPLIYASANPPRSTPVLRYLKRPFGFSMLVQTIKAAGQRPDSLAFAIEKSGFVGMPASFDAKGKLLGLDETGGLLELYFPIMRGGALSISHELLNRLWGGRTTVQITGTMEDETRSDVWIAYFKAPSAGASKENYWAKLLHELERASDS
jgi:hypothetical protein